MKKGGLVIALLALSLVLSISMVSAVGVGSWWGKITGKVTSPSCTDSDGGVNADVRGTVTCGQQTYTDSCYSDTSVLEYEYDAGIDDYNSRYLTCASGKVCKEGACVSTTSTGERKSVPTKTQVCLSNIIEPIVCELSAADNGGVYGRYPASIKLRRTLADSTVNFSSIEVKLMTGTDVQYALSAQAAVTLAGGQGAAATIYAGADHNTTLSTSTQVSVTSSYILSDGSKVFCPSLPLTCAVPTSSRNESVQCTDSDGGKNYYISGVAKTLSNKSDYALDSAGESCVENTNKVIESYCIDGDPQVRQEYFECPFGCKNGACLKDSAQNAEVTRIREGASDYMVLETTLKDGEVTIPIAYADVNGKFIGNGKGSSDKLANQYFISSENHLLIFNYTDGDRTFVATNNQTGESYYLRFDLFSKENDVNKVNIQKRAEGSWVDVCKERKQDDTCTIGGLTLTIHAISPHPDRTVYVKTKNTFSFNQVATKSGLLINLPYSSQIVITRPGTSDSLLLELGANSDREVEVSKITGVEMKSDPADSDHLIGYTPSGVKVERVGKSSDQREAIITVGSSGSTNTTLPVNAVCQELIAKKGILHEKYKGFVLENSEVDATEDFIGVKGTAYQVEYEHEGFEGQGNDKEIQVLMFVADDQKTDMGQALDTALSEENDLWTPEKTFVGGKSQWYYTVGEHGGRAYVWFNQNVLVVIAVESRTSEDEEGAGLGDVVGLVENLKSNEFKPVTRDDKAFSFLNGLVEDYLRACPSAIEEQCVPRWEIKTEPAVCPPHGNQKIIMRDMNQCTRKSVIEESRQCSPGICAGCTVPRYMGFDFDKGNNVCIPYGTRLAFEDSQSVRLHEGENDGELLLTIVSENEAQMVVYDQSLSSGLNRTPVIVGKYKLQEGQKTSINFEGEAITFMVNDITFVESRSSKNTIDISVIEGFNAYCNYDGSILPQKTKKGDGSWASCQNNYECDSNLCSGGECVEINDAIRQVKGFKGLTVKALCRMANIFSEKEYGQCISEYLGKQNTKGSSSSSSGSNAGSSSGSTGSSGGSSSGSSGKTAAASISLVVEEEVYNVGDAIALK